jgi:hypothetical protein
LPRGLARFPKIRINLPRLRQPAFVRRRTSAGQEATPGAASCPDCHTRCRVLPISRQAPKRWRLEWLLALLRSLPGCEQLGAHSSIRKSALLALYLAADRLPSAPRMMARPSAVQMLHFHLRPRLFNRISKTGNWCGGIPVLRCAWVVSCQNLLPFSRRLVHLGGLGQIAGKMSGYAIRQFKLDRSPSNFHHPNG